MDLPGGHGSSGDGGKGRSGIGVRQHGSMIEEAREIVAVQRLRRGSVEPGIGQDLGYEGLIHSPCAASTPPSSCVNPRRASIRSLIGALAGPVSKAKAHPGFGPRGGGVDPGDVADAAEIEEGDRFGGADMAGKRDSGRRARAVRPARPSSRPRCGSPRRLAGQAAGPGSRRCRIDGCHVHGVMRKGLAVKAKKLGPGEPGEDLGMGGFHHFGRRGHGGVHPAIGQGPRAR
jgi:hypothetical protein